MLLAAGGLTACLLLVAAVLPPRLASATWPSRAPSYALVLWQAVGLVGGLLAIEIAITVGLSPAGPTHLAALRSLLDGSARSLPWWSLVAFAIAFVITARLLAVLVGSAARTLSARHRHRVLVDLVATRNPLLSGTRVVDHDLPLAYCLPGLRPRVVLSRGVLELLRDDEVRAVLAHESAHIEQRHDLVVLPFVALGATFPRLPAVRTAQAQVALLVEMLADDRAVRSHPRRVLARALYQVGAADVPAGGVGAGPSPGGVLQRASRLVSPCVPLPVRARVGVLATTAGVLAVPVLGLLAPLIV